MFELLKIFYHWEVHDCITEWYAVILVISLIDMY